MSGNRSDVNFSEISLEEAPAPAPIGSYGQRRSRGDSDRGCGGVSDHSGSGGRIFRVVEVVAVMVQLLQLYPSHRH